MAENEKKCPCETVLNLQERVEIQREQLAKGETQFAVINTKLNLIMAVMGTIGAALVGVVIKLMIG
jgi:hypothetical protein